MSKRHEILEKYFKSKIKVKSVPRIPPSHEIQMSCLMYSHPRFNIESVL